MENNINCGSGNQKTVPNQKLITVKKKPCGKDNLYVTINLTALQLAMTRLKPQTLKLWLYFAKNQNNYQFALSAKAAEKFGVAKTSYYRAIEELMEKGYLVEMGGNLYTFYEESVKVTDESEKPC